MSQIFTAILEREGDLVVALCPELDVASQGGTLDEALSNLREAISLFLEFAGSEEIEARTHGPILVTQVEVPARAS